RHGVRGGDAVRRPAADRAAPADPLRRRPAGAAPARPRPQAPPAPDLRRRHRGAARGARRRDRRRVHRLDRAQQADHLGRSPRRGDGHPLPRPPPRAGPAPAAHGDRRGRARLPAPYRGGRARRPALLSSAPPVPCLEDWSAVPPHRRGGVRDVRSMMSLQLRTPSRLGRPLSVIGQGCWQIGADWGEVTDEAAHGVLDAALEAGVRFFDTADVYGDGRSEQLLRGLRERLLADGTAPEDLPLIATKASRRADPFTPESFTEEAMR